MSNVGKSDDPAQGSAGIEARSSTDASGTNSIELRLAAVELKMAEEEASLVRRVSTYGALVALVISIATGTLGVYESTVVRNRMEVDQAASEVRRSVARITEINWKLMELQLSGDVQKASNVARVANGEKFSLLDSTSHLIEKYEDVVSAPELLVLSFEHLNMGESKRALAFSRLAEKATSSDLMKAEALRYSAKAMMAPGADRDLFGGRSAFRSAIDRARQVNSYVSSAVMANVYVDWIASEIYFGDCGRAIELSEELRTTLADRGSPLQESNAADANIGLLYGQQTRCSPEAGSVRSAAGGSH